MNRILAFLALVLLLIPQIVFSDSKSSAKIIVITHVTVIDVRGKSSLPDMTVVIQGERIVTIGKTDKVKLPGEAQVIDATGKFLIPGLWDMHVHSGNSFGELYIANGVTGVRDMFTPMPAIQSAREAIATGKQTGPRIVAAGRIIDGEKPIWPGSIAVKNAVEGRQAVTTVRNEGSDFVKVYSLLSRDAYFAIADEAKKQGIPFAGHVPLVITAAEASDAGQKSMEHLYGILLGCSKREEEVMKGLASMPATATRQALGKMLAEIDYDETKAGKLFAKFVKNQTWQCPTLTVLRSIASLDDANFTNDARLQYLPSGFKNFWNPQNDFRMKAWTKEDWQIQRKNFEKNKILVGKMRRAGVEFIAGTDVMNPFCFPGFSLHDELALLVESGFTPLEALQAATFNPARYLGTEKTLGTIEEGKLADLVLLDANPLVEIQNTQKIYAVIANGKLFTQADLQAMLSKSATAGKTN